jgi:hypothetical protein
MRGFHDLLIQKPSSMFMLGWSWISVISWMMQFLWEVTGVLGLNVMSQVEAVPATSNLSGWWKQICQCHFSSLSAMCIPEHAHRGCCILPVSSGLGHSWLAKTKLEIFPGRMCLNRIVLMQPTYGLTGQEDHCAEMFSQDDWESDESASCGNFSFNLTWEAQVHFAGCLSHTELRLWKAWLAYQVYVGRKDSVGGLIGFLMI